MWGQHKIYCPTGDFRYEKHDSHLLTVLVVYKVADTIHITHTLVNHCRSVEILKMTFLWLDGPARTLSNGLRHKLNANIAHTERI